ncbi:hypothetical protein RR48_07266 [Papilio machaon]|uniref:Uncharacterized protein n=1 Tax=Papilio machaon TaxID=76193 RepID=A0A194RLX9_PAPMA|nr:hypothetical protein RR48_07266 [Papilio machaon]
MHRKIIFPLVMSPTLHKIHFTFLSFPYKKRVGRGKRTKIVPQEHTRIRLNSVLLHLTPDFCVVVILHRARRPIRATDVVVPDIYLFVCYHYGHRRRLPMLSRTVAAQDRVADTATIIINSCRPMTF